MAIASSQAYIVPSNVAVVEMTDMYNDFTKKIEVAGADRSTFTGCITFDTNNPPEHYLILGGVINGPDDPVTGLPNYRRSFDMRLQYPSLRAHLDPIVSKFAGAEYFETGSPTLTIDSGMAQYLKVDHEWDLQAVTGETQDKAIGERLFCTVLALVPVLP